MAAEDQREWGGWVKPAFSDAVERECRAVRQQVGMIDMSSFGKIDLHGPGELGWELYIPAGDAVFVWDRLWQAGKKHSVKAFGYKAVDALRLEKGYLALAGDITAADNPYEARLGFCVKWNAGDFIGRQALIRNKAENSLQRLYTLVIGDEEYLTLYGGEAVLSDGKVISRLRSAGYGHTIKKNIGFVYLPVDMADGKPRLEVEIFGETVTAEVAADILYDPEGNALRK